MTIQRVRIRFKKKTDIDFGLLDKDYSDGEFRIKKSFWKRYLNARDKFEELQDYLIERVPIKIREKYFKDDNERINEIQRKIEIRFNKK